MKQVLSSALASRPPMGWNSWDCFCCTVTEEEVKQNADFIAQHLKPYGWEYVVVDLGWYLHADNDHHQYKEFNTPHHIDEYGRLIPDTTKFPSAANGAGFKPLADYVHSLGLKFGIHIMRGIPMAAAAAKSKIKGTNLTADQISYDRERCPWYNSLLTLDFSKPGAQEYYNSCFELYASWGVDYIKADDLNAWHEVHNSDGSPTGNGSPYRIDDIEGIAQGITNSGRGMVLSLSPGGPETTIINHLRNHSHLWRISADFWDEWGSLKKQMDRCAIWAPFVKEGHWPDADMLPLGYMPRGESGGQERFTNFTEDEQYTLMSLWAMFRSPLMFGGHLPQTPAFTIGLLSNDEVMAVNQTSANGRQFAKTNDSNIWIADDPINGGKYVAFFNIADENSNAISISFSDLGMGSTCQVRDLWRKEDLGSFDDQFAAVIRPHGAGLFKVS